MESYDVYVSYHRRQDREQARLLARFLDGFGYRVWFDEWALNRKDSLVPQDKREVMLMLKAAISRSRCVVLFAMQAKKLPPTVDRDRALRTLQAIEGPAGLIAWNWQSFEAQSAREAIVLYPGWSRKSVLNALEKLAIPPSRPPRRSAPSGTSLPHQIWRRLTRRGRVTRRICSLAPPESDEGECDPETMTLLISEFFGRSLGRDFSAVVLIGDHGTGRTTIATKAMQHARFHMAALDPPAHPPAEYYSTQLPAYDDLEVWGRKLTNLGRAVALIDDFGDALLARPAEEWEMILETLRVSTPEHADLCFLLVVTEEQAEEWLTDDRDQDERFRVRSQFLLERLRVRAIRMPDSRSVWKLNAIAEARLSQCVSRKFTWSTKYWSLNQIIRALEQLPVAADLRPLDRTTLEGTLIGNPGKLLASVTQLATLAESESDKSAETVTISDDQVMRTLRRATGLGHAVWGGPDSSPGYRALVAEFTGASGNQLNMICRTTPKIPARDRPWATVLIIADKSRREKLAGHFAELLYGSRDAILALDFGANDEQDYLTRIRCTESLAGLLRAIARYPFWVVCFERLDQATNMDLYTVRGLLDKGFGADSTFPATAAALLRNHCLVIVDSLELLEIPDYPEDCAVTIGWTPPRLAAE